MSTANTFTTQLGSAGAPIAWTIITSLGSAGDETSGPANSLQGLAHSSKLSGNYVLGANITASATSGWNAGAGFVPIGTSTSPFTGRFDGLGHTIEGLTINRPASGYQGLFGRTNGATLRNVGLTNASVTGANNIGALVGYNFNNSHIHYSYSEGTVNGNNWVGGLAGVNQNNSTISNSTASGTVNGNNRVGGLAGANYDNSTISNSTASGNVTGNDLVGGLVGFNWISSTISNSTASGNVTGNDLVGGLVGRNENNSTISNSTASGTVNGVDYVGGLVGSNDNDSTISNSTASGTVNGTNDVGGLVGVNYVSSTISNSTASGTVNGVDYVGGLVGSNDNDSTISNSAASGNVSGSNYVGGLAGYNLNNSTVNRSYALGQVSASGNDAGGLVGNNNSGAGIGESFAFGNVVANGTNAGGLAGTNNGTIVDSYARGNASGISNVGGLVGTNIGTINRTYSTGTASGGSAGGLVGVNSGTVNNSFWDTTTSGTTTSAGGNGLATADMQSLSTYTAAGWGIDDVGSTSNTWRIYDQDTYPLLRWPLTLANISAANGGKVYDGNAVTLADINPLFTHTVSLLTGGNALGAVNAGNYTARRYSDSQFGYNLVGTRIAYYVITGGPGSPENFTIEYVQQLLGDPDEADQDKKGMSWRGKVRIRVVNNGIRVQENLMVEPRPIGDLEFRD